MAFNPLNLERVAGGVRHVWIYRSTEGIGTVAASGYFNDAAAMLDQFDLIQVTSATGGTPRFDVLSVSSASRAATVTTIFSTPSTTWVNKPAHADGLEMYVSDVGVGGSRWRSDGTKWRCNHGVCLFSSAIPFVIAPTGTMGDNGALTLGTALNRIIPNAYVYLPANAISAGSAAGFYYAVFSSTTAAIVYNNVWSGAAGQPAIPTSPTPFVTTGPGAYTGSTSTLTVAIGSMPGRVMGADGAIEFTAEVSYPNNANSKTVTVKFGGTNAYSLAQTTTTGDRLTGTIQNQGREDRQLFGCTNRDGPGTGTIAYGNVDSTGTVSITATCAMAVATDYLVFEGWRVMLYPN
jgi:hypothetical protein